MRDRIEALKNRAEEQILCAETLKELDELRIKLVGKKGELTEIMKGMRDLSKRKGLLWGSL